MPSRIVAGVILCVGILAALLGVYSSSVGAASTPRSTPVAPTCHFTRGDTDAYAFESVVTADAAAGHAERDRFAGVLSWVVVEAEGTRPALVRASLGQVELDQSLTSESGRARAALLEGAPFFVHIDENCRFGDVGFGDDWRPANRELVTTLLASAEIVLPAEHRERWEAVQRDGLGDYTARYTMGLEVGDEGVLHVVRSIEGYHEDAEAIRAGIQVQVVSSEADALFDPARPGWMNRLEVRSQVRFHVPGQAIPGMVHTLSLTRESSRYLAVSEASHFTSHFTEVREVGAIETLEAPIDPALTSMAYEDALANFLVLMDVNGPSGTYAAARALSDWLRLHPDGAALLLADLRDGAIDDGAHAALFLALQLAGDDASRQVLLEAMVLADLGEVDRARAAVALADHGTPTRVVADALLARVHDHESPTVANVSLLGLGRMVERAEEGSPLRDALRTTLTDELASASDVHDEVAVIEALGNTRDASFEGALEERLGAEDARLRAHAAHALAHMPSENARPALLEQLDTEDASEVRTAILGTLRGIDGEPRATRDEAPGLSPEELALAARLLTAEEVPVRAAAIEWVGRSAHRADARALLAGHFAVEPVLQLKQRIGEFVSAAELQAAL